MNCNDISIPTMTDFCYEEANEEANGAPNKE